MCGQYGAIIDSHLRRSSLGHEQALRASIEVSCMSHCSFVFPKRCERLLTSAEANE